MPQMWNELSVARSMGLQMSPVQRRTPHVMTYRKHLKNGLLLILECNLSPTVVLLKLSRNQIAKVIEAILPDDPEEEPVAMRFDLRAGK